MSVRTFRYAPGFRRLLDYAAYDCAERGEREVRVDHLTLALYREDFPLIDEVLASFRVDSMVVLDRLLRANPAVGSPLAVAEVELSPTAMQAIGRGETEADLAGDGLLTTAHVFLGILHHRRDNIQDFFIREEFVPQSHEVLARVRDRVRWLRLGRDARGERELDILDDGTLISLDSLPPKTVSINGRRAVTQAIRLRMLKQFS